MINAIADAFAYSNLRRKTETSRLRRAIFCRREIVELQSEIRRGEETLVNYAKNHQIISLDASQNTVLTGCRSQQATVWKRPNRRKSRVTPPSQGAAGSARRRVGETCGGCGNQVDELRQKAR